MPFADTFQPKPSDRSEQALFLILITLCFMAASPAQTDGVIVVIDTSGSMASVAPELKSAVKRFLSELPAGAYVGLVSFDTFSHVHTITRLNTPGDLAQLNAQLDALHFTGAKTNLDEGIKGTQVPPCGIHGLVQAPRSGVLGTESRSETDKTGTAPLCESANLRICESASCDMLQKNLLSSEVLRIFAK